jgi:hypothetical protein
MYIILYIHSHTTLRGVFFRYFKILPDVEEAMLDLYLKSLYLQICPGYRKSKEATVY